MKAVFQTVVDKDSGNCLQAVIASMFDLNLNDVPNFVEYADSAEWYFMLCDFFESKGYDIETVSCNPNYINKNDLYIELLSQLDINGAIYAGVKSSLYEGGGHAILINSLGICIHDPNPNNYFLGKDVVETGDIEVYTRVSKLDF